VCLLLYGVAQKTNPPNILTS